MPFFILVMVGCQSPQEVKFQQYMSQGEHLYATHCMNCHQSDGSGLGRLIPPLKNSYAIDHLSLAVCSIKYGLEGDITVDSVKYNGKMPANPALTSLEIAEILTYITNSWGQRNEMISVDKTDSLLQECNRY